MGVQGRIGDGDGDGEGGERVERGQESHGPYETCMGFIMTHELARDGQTVALAAQCSTGIGHWHRPSPIAPGIDHLIRSGAYRRSSSGRA
jgi:hypothetical protein